VTDPADPIRAAGLRRTPARVQVLGVIGAAGRPLTHAELAAHPEIAGMDAITLYRTLATLKEAGLVHRVQGTDGVWRSCAQPGVAGCPGNHAHFLCTGCARMECLVDQPMPRVNAPDGATVEGRHFVAYGRCSACGSDSGEQSRS
jgi:Fur family ferric uptake transcriptional regulator/Fur family zinc uptake transcriptional regulator